MYLRSFLYEDANVVQHTSSKKKEVYETGEKATWESRFFTYPNELKNVVYKKLDASKKKIFMPKIFFTN